MNKRNKFHTKFVKSIATLVLATTFFLSGVVILWAATLKMPDLSSFEERKVSQSTKIYDKTGEVLLYDVHQDIRRTIVPLEEISDNLKKATIAIEDSEFYSHGGIRIDAIVRAVFKNLSEGGFSQGGSTITQQVIKNSVLTTDKKISRKIKEWILALKIEKQLTKDEILELYLNESPYGGNVYGAEEASRTFFNKNASELTLAEAAYLAALPKAPTYYSPHGSHVKELEARQRLVLDQMLKHELITEEEHGEALDTRVEFQPRPKFGILAPHFVFFVREYLADRYGEELVEEGGLKVTTTLDWELQEKAEEIVTKHALENTERYNAENAGMVAIDPKTGQILVMVGSRGYFDEKIQGAFNITTTHRQPGSAFKPVVYAAALEKGYTPETVVFDLQTQFSTACDPGNLSNESPCYSPSNYDDKFRGPVTFRTALAQSLNVPAVKVLYLAGLDASLRLAKKMGIESLENKERYGLTLVLGGGEVSLLDLTSAYTVFANDGKRNPYTPILKVETADGQVLEEYDQFKTPPQEVLPEQIARQISDMLSDNVARTPAFGASSYLNFPGIDVAAKTGTTNDYKDAWIIGYTPEIAVGSWAGNNDNTSMEKRVAGFIVAPMWNEFFQEALKEVPHTSFTRPRPETVSKPVLRGMWQGGRTFFVDNISGGLATEFTPDDLKQERVVTSVHSILYWVNKSDPRGPYPTNPSSDPQFRQWEHPVRLWATGSGYQDQSDAVIPTERDSAHNPDNAPKFQIQVEDSTLKVGDSLRVKVEVSKSEYKVERVEYYINDIPVGSSTNKPSFPLTIELQNPEGLRENNQLKAIAYDEVLNKSTSITAFKISNVEE